MQQPKFMPVSNEDMQKLNTLPQIGWSGEHPDFERIPVQEIDAIYND